MHDRLTRDDIRKMEEEIEHRKLVVRPQALEAVKEARAHGDLSENFEYHAAKREKNRNESRIRYLERMVKTAHIIEDNSAENEIGLNTQVDVLFEDEGVVETYRIVTTVREDSLNGLISIESPLGKALMGHKEGERVLVTINPQLSYYVTIQSITKMDDESNDKIRGF